MPTKAAKVMDIPPTCSIPMSNSTYSSLSPIPTWVKDIFSPLEMAPQFARYCLVRNICSRYKDGHALLTHKEMPTILTKDDADGLKELSRLGVIRLWLNGTSREFEIVEEEV